MDEGAHAREWASSDPGSSGILGEVGRGVPPRANAVEVTVVLREAKVSLCVPVLRTASQQLAPGRDSAEVSNELLEDVEPAHLSSVSPLPTIASRHRTFEERTADAVAGEEMRAVPRRCSSISQLPPPGFHDCETT
jgi:hypothetical protein